MDKSTPFKESAKAQSEPNWLDELMPMGIEMAKTGGLFLNGRLGLATTLSSYALGEVIIGQKGKSFDQWAPQEMCQDVLLGAAKGGLMKGYFAGLGSLKMGVAFKGVALGEASRSFDAALSRSTYRDAAKEGTSSLFKILGATYNPMAMASDAAVFVAAHGMFNGLKSVSKTISERPIVATTLTGATFGLAGGSANEILRQQEQKEELDLGKVAFAGLTHAAMDSVAAIPGGLQADEVARKQCEKFARQMARETKWRYWSDIARIKPKELKLEIPKAIIESNDWQVAFDVVKEIKQAGYEAYFVGGCVRDILIGKTPKDFDLVTNATPEQLLQLYPYADLTGKNFGVLRVRKRKIEVEIATFRSDGDYSNGRQPDDVTLLSKLPVRVAMREDSGRRDLTINSMFLDPETHTAYYYFDGPGDLAAKRIDTVGDPHARFKEDPSRMLRVARFVSQFEDFEPTPRVVKAMTIDAPSIHRSAHKSWGMELSKMMMSPYPVKGLQLLKKTGLIKEMMPEMDRLDSDKGEQDPFHHPEGNTWDHTMLVVDRLVKSARRNLILMYGGLFHDVGKPDTQVRTDNGRITNYGHDVKGAEITKKICERIEVGDKEAIEEEVVHHMAMHAGPKMTKKTLYKYLNLPNIENLIELQDADALGRGKCCSPENTEENFGSQREFWENALKEARYPSNAAQAIDAKAILDGNVLKSLGYGQGISLGVIKNAGKFAQFSGEFSDMDGALSWLNKYHPLTEELRNPPKQPSRIREQKKKRQNNS